MATEFSFAGLKLPAVTGMQHSHSYNCTDMDSLGRPIEREQEKPLADIKSWLIITRSVLLLFMRTC